MSEKVSKKPAKGKKKVTMPQSIALDQENQSEFENKVSEIKSEIEDGVRKIPGYSGTPGVIYVGCLPRGFHEKQMQNFFSQFGKVLKLRLSRSKKTGNPKGYAFIMFEYDEVAKVVADTMNNYLMFQKLLKCRHLAAEDVHPKLFKGCYRKFTKPKAHLLAIERHNANKTEATMQKIAKRTKRKVQKKIDKLASIGVNYSVIVGETSITARRDVTSASLLTPITPTQTPVTPPDTPITPPETPSTHPAPVLVDDSSDDEIKLKTPPGSVRVRKQKAKIEKIVKKTKTKAITTNSKKTKGRRGALGSAKQSTTRAKRRVR